MGEVRERRPITLTYKNWRGEVAERTIVPINVWYGSTEWHPEPQWLLSAYDVEKKAVRDFALKDFGHAQVAECDMLREVIKRAEERLAQIDCATLNQHNILTQSDLVDYCKRLASAGLTEIYKARAAIRLAKSQSLTAEQVTMAGREDVT